MNCKHVPISLLFHPLLIPLYIKNLINSKPTTEIDAYNPSLPMPFANTSNFCSSGVPFSSSSSSSFGFSLGFLSLSFSAFLSYLFLFGLPSAVF